MGRKIKYKKEVKVKACEDYLFGRKSAMDIAKELHMGKNGECDVREWSRKYKVLGASAFEETHSNRKYTKEFKQRIVGEYLNGSGSSKELAIRHSIPSSGLIRAWISKYTKGEETKGHKPSGEIYTMPRTRTSLDQRIEIVAYCLENSRDYKKTALKYGVSYHQVYDWVKRYCAKGEDGLNDKRGIRKSETELTPEEAAQKRIRELEQQNRLLIMENEVLKKAQALEQKELLLQGFRKKH